MGKKRTDNGGLMSVDDALYHAVHDYQHGGLPALAIRLDMSRDVLRKKVDPECLTHVTQLKEAIRILRITRHEGMLNAINAEAGAVWSFEDELPEYPGDVDIFATSNRLMDAGLKALKEFQKALEDGDIDDDEFSKITLGMTGIDQAQQLVMRLVEKYRSGVA